jgi:uncharacterized protein YbjT (DUF2867 family)
MIVIIGASGAAGTPAIAELVKRGAAIRALTSNEKSAAKLKARGVAETIIGDFRKPADVARVIEGAERVMLIPPAMVPDQTEIGLGVVAAAKAAKISHFVFLSCVHPQIRVLVHHWQKLAIEEAVVEAGMDYTILQPSMYMQNLVQVWHHVVKEGVVRWPWNPDQTFNFIDTRDLGEVIAISLTTDRLRNGSFELFSGDKLTMHRTAQILGEEMGRPIRAEKLSAEAFRQEKSTVLSPWRIENMLNTSKHYDEHGLGGGNPLVATAILGRAPHDYRSFVRHYLQTIQWSSQA